MRSCPEKTKIHTYIDSQKARQLGAKRNKRQFSTLAKGCGKSAGPRAGRADGGPFAGGVRTRRPPRLRPHRPFSLAASLRGRKCFSRLQVEKLRPRELRSPCWAVMEADLSRGLSGPCLFHADAAHRLKGSHCPPAHCCGPPSSGSSKTILTSAS